MHWLLVLAIVCVSCRRQPTAERKEEVEVRPDAHAEPSEAQTPASDAGDASQGTARGDGARRVPISLGGSLQNPCWSPDGRELVVTSFAAGYNRGSSRVGRVSVAGGTPVELAGATAQNVNLPGACWNASLQRIVFSSDEDSQDEIFLVHPMTAERTRITRRRDERATEPSFSPDGKFIVFESHPKGSDGHGSIWKVRTDGRELVRLTDGRSNDKQPNWSSSGERILFQSTRNGNFDIYTIDPKGRSPKNVTHSSADDTDGAWSPDGKYIVYSSDEGGLEQANLFIIGRDGSPRLRLTRGRRYDGAPSWSADGQFIAFESSESDGDPEQTGRGTQIYIIAAPSLP